MFYMAYVTVKRCRHLHERCDFEWEFIIVRYGYTWLQTMTPEQQ